MGNHVVKGCLCSAGAGDISRRYHHSNANPFGNSICYVRPPDLFSTDNVTTITTFRSVSGASVSANSSTPPSTTFDSLHHSATNSPVVLDSSASFESSPSFTSMPLQQQHASCRDGSFGGSCNPVWCSPMERGFSSGPVVLGALMNERDLKKKLRRRFSHDNGFAFEDKSKKQSVRKILKRVISGSFVKRVVSIGGYKKKKENDIVKVDGDDDGGGGDDDKNSDDHPSLDDNDDDHHHPYLSDDNEKFNVVGSCCSDFKNQDFMASVTVADRELMGCENLEWAEGRAGEDRVHIVISEEHGWVFVGIYDGFNGPDATDYLLDNLFHSVHDELKGMLCGDTSEKVLLGLVNGSGRSSKIRNTVVKGCCSSMLDNWDSLNCWKKLELSVKGASSFGHSDALVGLSEALRKTEDAFLKKVDEVIGNNPVLTMMGSCVLVMLMKGEDVYLMNVGDSRAILADHSVNSLQLTMEHSTLVKEEVDRIMKEHPDDPCAITKGRVKGYLNVTRAFGAGFLKEPKQNNAVLESLKVNYIGESPYIVCSPSLYHHRLRPSDRFLILCSDGLQQYFTNEEAVAIVDSFITSSPDTDPAQLLINEALFRAAKKAGMDFHELLNIPHGERRLYHDDISIVIISFKGKIWRSSL
ncbi:probable protein phosphatase 2C 4 [Vigna unguiculata]|uniref:probable protein phosphatase 2C 4 n=1 Tax=Vigna unguiculata TaxID=3917 RepID=UPI001016A5F3|nr:probable protein phosphatase 2C 4 [Vigna unguiculata]